MNNVFNKVSYLFTLALVSVPGFFALAEILPNTPKTTGGTSGQISTQPLPRLDNPIAGVNSFADLVAAVLKIIVQVGVPVAVLFLMYSGYMFVTAKGDMTQIETARTSLLYTSIGIAILLGAQIIAGAIGTTIQQLQ